MLIAEIASILLDDPASFSAQDDNNVFPWKSISPNSLKVINGLLWLWSEDFPEFDDLTSAATWADHIKCTGPGSFCRSETHLFDGIEIFNTEHFADIPYRPHSNESSTNQTIRRYAYSPGNAYHLLQQISRSLSPRLSLRDAGLASLKEVMTMNKHSLRQRILSNNRSISYAYLTEPVSRSSSPPSFISYHDLDSSTGTVFSINLLMRLFIHIWGDIHQPLHTMSLFDPPCFPNGDRGGTEIIIRVNSTRPSAANEGSKNITDNEITNLECSLHALWDGMGLIHTSAGYPLASRQAIHDRAVQLMRENPASIFAEDMIAVDIHDVFEESHSMAQMVYRELEKNLVSQCPTYHTPFEPSLAYIHEVQMISRKQIALAGYRLAAFLNMFADDFNDELKRRATQQQQRRQSEVKKVNLGNASLMLSSVSSLLLVLNAVLLFYLWKKNRAFSADVSGTSTAATPLLVD